MSRSRCLSSGRFTLGDISLEGDDEKTAYKKLSKVRVAANHIFETGCPRDAFVAMQFQELTVLITVVSHGLLISAQSVSYNLLAATII